MLETMSVRTPHTLPWQNCPEPGESRFGHACEAAHEGVDYSHPLPLVPDLCAEVLLDNLATHDVDRRVDAYLAGAAREVIIVDRFGRIYFWREKGAAADLGIRD